MKSLARLSLPLMLLVAWSPSSLAHPAASGTPAGSAGENDGWYQTMSARIADEEYRASVAEAGLQAPNRAHGLRTYFRAGAIEVVPRAECAAERPPLLTWHTSRWGRQGHMQTAEPSAPETAAAGARVVYRRAGFEEWYANDRKGVEQGFTLNVRPTGTGWVRLEGRIGGVLRAEMPEPDAVSFLDEGGALVLRYAELHAWDARGHALPARLELTGEDLALLVDDQGAQYPVTIDPLMTSPSWTAESNQTAAFFGAAVATAGDVNGDGFSDVLVGAPFYDNGQSDEGRAYLYLGSAAGLSATAAWTAEGDQASAHFGSSVATAGDTNGDGYTDVIVGAPNYDNGQSDEGRASVYLGSSGGLSATPVWTSESDWAFDAAGRSVATAGDVNGDGMSDVLVGSERYLSGQRPGGVYVYLGTPSGPNPTLNRFIAEGPIVAPAGDVNGDGYADIIIGGGDSASVYIGSSTGLGAGPIWTGRIQDTYEYGTSVATAGDVNGDGYSDVIVGDPELGLDGVGAVYVYQGSASGLPTSPSWSAQGVQAGSDFGHSVGTAGDVNGDGYADVIVGADAFTVVQSFEGRAYLYFGSSSGLGSAPQWLDGTQTDGAFGVSVATGGDVNGDGFSDVIVGASWYDNGQSEEGRAFVYHGSAAGPSTTANWTAEGNQAGPTTFGISVSSAGDVNGDGYGDVIVGAAQYDNGQVSEGAAFVYHGSASGLSTTSAWSAEGNLASAAFGYSAAAAGDVNGDGYGDVVVGSHYYGNGELNEGRAFVYHGSASGLSATPAWTAESNQLGAEFGVSVASAGDVNGDGYADVIVGAWVYSNGQNGEGRAYVYHGSTTGLANSPAWTAESDLASANFGLSVGTAGDVNGDGYSDVVVGAPWYSGNGRAFAFHGSASGLATTAAWQVNGFGSSYQFGSSVGTAGDVNGDGFSDVIVGEPGAANEGKVHVYHGSASGLHSVEDWSPVYAQAGAQLGAAVATAGDVNGDGFSDVIVGASLYDNGESNEGRALVFYGSAATLGASPAWTGEGNQANAWFGFAVASAGDVNGDGFSDIVVGAPLFDNGQTDEGRAFIYYGNGGAGLAPLPRQTGTDGAPIPPLGLSDAPSGFRLQATARTPAGRGKVRLQWEVKPAATPFNGTGLVTGSSYDTGAPSLSPRGEAVPNGSSVTISELVTGLSAGTLYHWRARVLRDSPFFPRSEWLREGANTAGGGDVRTSTVTAVADGASSTAFSLEAIGPAPSSHPSGFAFTLPARGPVHLGVYDLAGREVAVIAEGEREAGRHTEAWSGRGTGGDALPAGVYFVQLLFAGRTEARKIVLAR